MKRRWFRFLDALSGTHRLESTNDLMATVLARDPVRPPRMTQTGDKAIQATGLGIDEEQTPGALKIRRDKNRKGD